MGERIRRVITKRIFDADKAATTKTRLQLRQWGTGVRAGAEAIALAHLLIEYLWAQRHFTNQFAVIQVGQKNCFGQLEHKCNDEAIIQ